MVAATITYGCSFHHIWLQVWPARVVEPVGSEEVRAAAEAASATATATARVAAQAREG